MPMRSYIKSCDLFKKRENEMNKIKTFVRSHKRVVDDARQFALVWLGVCSHSLVNV